jgi:hypothetical protein
MENEQGKICDNIQPEVIMLDDSAKKNAENHLSGLLQSLKIMSETDQQLKNQNGEQKILMEKINKKINEQSDKFQKYISDQDLEKKKSNEKIDELIENIGKISIKNDDNFDIVSKLNSNIDIQINEIKMTLIDGIKQIQNLYKTMLEKFEKNDPSLKNKILLNELTESRKIQVKQLDIIAKLNKN